MLSSDSGISKEHVQDLFERFISEKGFIIASGWHDDARGGIQCRLREAEAKRGTSSAIAHLYFSAPQTGVIVDFKGENLKWKLNDALKQREDAARAVPRFTKAELRAQEQAQLEREAKAKEAEKLARYHAWLEYRDAREITPQTTGSGIDYLHKKRVGAAPYVRLSPQGALLIPYFHPITGQLVTTQSITPAAKRFAPGARIGEAGAVFWVSPTQVNRSANMPPPGSLIALAEGYATAWTFAHTSGLFCGTCANAGNLAKTAQAILKGSPNKQLKIIVAMDDDFLTAAEIDERTKREKQNTGRIYARKIQSLDARRVFLAPPPFDKAALRDAYMRGTIGKVSDWNDYAALYGTEAAKAAAATALKAAVAHFDRCTKG